MEFAPLRALGSKSLEEDSGARPANFSAPSVTMVSIVCIFTFAAILLVSGYHQVVDPFVRHDDFGALLLQPEAYYSKTLSEGRWLNYYWHLRSFQWPSWLNYAVYQAGWAVFCGSLAHHASMTRSKENTIFLAVLLAMSPQALIISGWFNTLVPGIWTISIYALITLYLTSRLSIILLLVFVPLSLLAYSTYPLLLLAVCLLRSDGPRSILGLVVAVSIFLLSFWLGLKLINLLNFFEHGKFALEVAGSRSPNPAHDLASLIENFRLVAWFFSFTADMVGFGNTPHGLGILALMTATIFAVLRVSFFDGLRLLVVLCTGFGLLIAYMLLEGTIVPFRATTFLWLVFGTGIVFLAELVATKAPQIASVARIVTLSATFFATYMAFDSYRVFKDWQASTIQLADFIPRSVSNVFIYGTYLALPGGMEAAIQHPRGLRLRLYQLSTVNIVLCREWPNECADIQPPFDEMPRFGDTKFVTTGSTMFIRLPAVDVTP